VLALAAYFRVSNDSFTRAGLRLPARVSGRLECRTPGSIPRLPGRTAPAPGRRLEAEADDAEAGRRAAAGDGAGDGGGGDGAGIGGGGVERAVLWRRRRRAAQDGREGLPALTRARR
jgi:hypothetical protein